jgi:CubicO group peptidase (beta-lactamase class C family)
MSPALLALVLSFAPAPPPQLSEAAFHAKIEGLMTASGAPGAALEVLRDGQVIYTQSHGLADTASGTPYSAELAFEIGSLSKQFTACALLALVQDGKLALDDTLGALLPDLPEAWRAITVEQVMHHVSGIPDYEGLAGYDFYNEPRTAEEVLAVAARQKPSFAPGARFEYSNTGYYILSLIVERKSGMPFDQYLAQRLFTPLEMRSTFTATRPPDVKEATGYHSRTGARVAQPPIAWSSSLGAGAIVSTLADLARWDEALYGERILPHARLAKIWEPTHANDGSPIPYGAGWFTDHYRGVEFVSHTGQTNGFSCAYLRFPAAHLSVLVNVNSYGGGIDALGKAAAVHFLAALNDYSLAVPEDEEPERTEEHRTALRQAVLAEGDLELLASGMKDFATGAGFAEMRKSLEPAVRTQRSFRFLRTGTLAGKNGPLDEFLYRATHEAGETFWTLRFSDGFLSSLDWADE